MSQFLLVVDIPPVEEGITSSVPMNAGGKWYEFEKQSKSIQLPKGKSSKPSRNVWLLDIENSLPFLLELSGLAQTCGLQYSAFMVSEDAKPMTKQKP